MTSSSDPHQITTLLHAWRGGDQQSFDQLISLIYGELRGLAGHLLRAESNATLQVTTLVNEAYLRLVTVSIPWQDRAHFFAVAANVMRRLLVDHARRRISGKRGGHLAKVSIDEALTVADPGSPDLIALDETLQSLEKQDPRMAKVVEMRVFAGMTIEDTAAVLGVSTGTVINEYRLARAWIYKSLRAE